MVDRSACLLVACWALALSLLGGCRGEVGAQRPSPRHAQEDVRRSRGARLPPPFEGRDPARLGLTQVEGLLWLKTQDVAAWDVGGRGVEADPGAGPGAGLSLRTNHVLLETDLGAERAVPLARAAQAHVEALVARHGESLDLRLPNAPLVVQVYARRSDFERALAAHVGHSHGWHAWYDAQEGRVRVAAEPAPVAALPLLADLRHELTHAVLDQGSPRPLPHARLAAGLHFWLWEGVAIDAEDLGGGFAPSAASLRAGRVRERRRASGLEPLGELLTLRQQDFEGRHYDQTGALMRFLATDPALYARTLAVLRGVLAGDLLRHDAARDFGLPLEALERRFLAWLDGGG